MEILFKISAIVISHQKYFQSGPNADTLLTIEWTNQHGCGGNEDNDPHKLNCNLVIQYMVQDYDGSQPGTVFSGWCGLQELGAFVSLGIGRWLVLIITTYFLIIIIFHAFVVVKV